MRIEGHIGIHVNTKQETMDSGSGENVAKLIDTKM